MSKIKLAYICSSCEWEAAKWVGKCPDCGEWNSLEEREVGSKSKLISQNDLSNKALSINDVKVPNNESYLTGSDELNRVLGGGITVGAITLLGGEPGVGKSTLLMNTAKGFLNNYSTKKIIYISGEETQYQIAQRAKRLKLESNQFLILNETNLQKIFIQLDQIKPDLIILDSVQTTMSTEVQALAGTPSQIKEVTHEIVNFSKLRNLACFIVGHITKDGSIAGPKLLEHMVDTVLSFEGDKLSDVRTLRVIKNRFGAASEVGFFEMTKLGLKDLSDQSQRVKNDEEFKYSGKAITFAMEGRRVMFYELQSLAVTSRNVNPKRTTQGVDSNRLLLLLAIIDKHLKIPISYNDIFLNVVGDIKLTTKTSDLAIIASLLSSSLNRIISSNTVIIGEVGLTGEVISPSNLDLLLIEIGRLGYKKVIVGAKPRHELLKSESLDIIKIQNVAEIVNLLFGGNGEDKSYNVRCA